MTRVRTLLIAVGLGLIVPTSALAESACESVDSDFSECADNPNSTFCQMLLADEEETIESIGIFIDSIRTLDKETRAALICARLLGRQIVVDGNTWTLHSSTEVINNVWNVDFQNMEKIGGLVSPSQSDLVKTSRYEICFKFQWQWEEVLGLLNELEGYNQPLSRDFKMIFSGRITGLWFSWVPSIRNVQGTYIQVEVDSFSISTEWADSKEDILPTLYKKRAEALEYFMRVRRE